MRNVSRKHKNFFQKWMKQQSNFKGIRHRDLWMALIVFAIGFLTVYSARAEVAPPTRQEWEAYAKLKPVKRFDYDRVYNDIENDVARLSVREEGFAQNLPMQLDGPMHAISKREYRGSNASIR